MIVAFLPVQADVCSEMSLLATMNQGHVLGQRQAFDEANVH